MGMAPDQVASSAPTRAAERDPLPSQGFGAPLARIAFRIGAASAAGFGSWALIGHSFDSLALTLAGLAIAGCGWWQSHEPTPRATRVLYPVLAVMGAVQPFLTASAVDAVGVAVAVAILVGGISIAEAASTRFVVFALVVWLWHVGFGLWLQRGDLDGGVLFGALVKAMALIVGLSVATRVKQGLSRSEHRHRYLFSHAPVGLWENDFSAIVPWLDDLRAAGVVDLGHYLDARPEEMRRMIDRIRIVGINPAAIEMIGGSSADSRMSGFSALLNDDAMQTFREQFVALWHGKTGAERIVTGRRIDGGTFRAVLRWSVETRDGEQDHSRVLVALSDITDLTHARRARLQAEGQFKAINDSATAAIISIDVEGRIVSWNPHAESMFGYPEEQAIGMSLVELMPGRFREAHQAGLMRVSSGEQRQITKPVELVGLRRDRSEFPIELSLGSWEREGEMFHTGIITDISERAEADIKLRNAEELQRQVVHAVGDAVIGVDLRLKITTWNRAAEIIYGWFADEVIGRHIYEVIEPPGHMVGGAIESAGGDGSAGEWEGTGAQRRKDGSEVTTFTRVRALRSDGGVLIGWVGVSRDVTQTLASERALQESVVSQAALLASKDYLIASVSHELRTPLASIYGYAHLLADEAESLDDADLAEIYKALAGQSSELAHLVEDLLVASRTDSEPLRVQTDAVALAAVASVTLDRLDVSAMAPIEVTGDATVTGDPLRIRQIIRNLVVNANRHGGQNCRLDIAVEGPLATLSVADDGPGVPKDRADQIFEPFVLGGAGRGPPESIGVGLTVSRRLARAMGGDLTYRRVEGVTLFTLTLPVARVHGDGSLRSTPLAGTFAAPRAIGE